MKKRITIVLSIIAFIVCIWFINFSNKQNIRVKVGKVDRIEKTSGNKDGFNTEVYYLLYTDRGTFRINIDGFIAHPEFAGTMKKDSIYDIIVCGVEVPFLGMYRNVIDVK